MNYITSLLNFTKIYQAVQKISTDPLYLKPEMPLVRFCPTLNKLVTDYRGCLGYHSCYIS
jgi:hypothetical protein